MSETVSTRYNKFSEFLKNRYGKKVQRISLNAGFSCPNLDGSLSYEGCIYCNNKSFGRNEISTPLDEQIRTGIVSAQKRYGADRFILYFQNFSNTYAPTAALKEKYDIIRNYSDFVCLCVGTRPDCIDEEKADLLASYSDTVDVWVELGLQSSNDETLKNINRGHSYTDFEKTVKILAKRKIEVFTHVILGLPGENIEDMVKTARDISYLPIKGVKIHPLHIVKRTKLEEMFLQNEYQPMSRDTYLDYLIAFLENLRKDMIIVRITADALGDSLIAPEWIKDKTGLLKAVDIEMEKRNAFQGKYASSGR